jgi:hypothetical protein
MIHLYLSYVPRFVTENQLRNVCRKLNLFSVKQIVFHSRNPEDNFHTGFIFINEWYQNKRNDSILNELKLGHSIYLLYQFPLYIKCTILKKNDYNYTKNHTHNHNHSKWITNI